MGEGTQDWRSSWNDSSTSAAGLGAARRRVSERSRIAFLTPSPVPISTRKTATKRIPRAPIRKASVPKILLTSHPPDAGAGARRGSCTMDWSEAPCAFRTPTVTSDPPTARDWYTTTY